LAKIKLRIGDNEIEIDSRDFYVDNNTIRISPTLGSLKVLSGRGVGGRALRRVGTAFMNNSIIAAE